MKPFVYIARKIDKNGLEDLYKHCRVKMHTKNTPPTRKELLKNSKNADAVMTVLTEKVDNEFLNNAKNLKIVANYAVGFDNIDLKAIKKHKIYASNTPGDLAGSVAEHSMALILSLSKRINEGDRYMRANKYKAWDPLLFLGNDVRGKTLGIIGVGRIGSALAKIASAGFDMKIAYTDVVKNSEIEKKYKAQKLPLNSLLKKADYISLNVPLLPSTRHLIGSRELNKMKQDAYMVNTARGPVIDEKALVKALKAKKIAGAGLDVFEFEPKMAPGLSKLDNVVLTPHIASATYAARKEMAEIAANNILDVLIAGKKPRNEIKV